MMVDGSEEGDKSPSRNGEEDMSDEEHAPIENDDDIIELGENEQVFNKFGSFFRRIS